MANKLEERKYHYIYKTTNLLNGKYYIGMHSTNNLEDGYLGSGKYLKRSIKKYGKENFKIEILEFLNNRKELANKEKEIVNEELIKDSLCMNLKLGGVGGLFSEEHLTKMRIGASIFLKNKWTDINYRNKMLQISSEILKKNHKEGKMLNSPRFKDRKHKEESKLKQSLAKKGKGLKEQNSQYGTCWITNEIENKKIYRGDLIPEGWRLGRR